MLATKAPKKRRYYSSQDGPSSASSHLFLVRYHDNSVDNYPCDGPFTNHEEAITASIEYLKKGICSWVVSYND